MPAAAEDRCTEFDRKLAHLPERRMRVERVREWLLGAAPEEACSWLGVALDRVPVRGPASDPLRDAILEVLTQSEPPAAPGDLEPIPYETRRHLYTAAVAADHMRLVALLRSHPPSTDAASGGRRLAPDVAEIPLGMRRSLAKGVNPLWLEKLALDPDPVVIANLLRNPRLREPDVVRIAALRPVSAATLNEIARAPRWLQRPRVRVALARNPHCPVPLAIKLIGRMPLPDLRAMRTDAGLSPATRSHVESELARRAGSR